MEGIIVLLIVFSLLVGAFAKGKNRSFLGWAILSLLISPILGFIIVAFAGDAIGNDDDK